MKEQKLEKQRQNLVERGVLSPDEKLYGTITINYTEKLVGRIETCNQGFFPIGMVITYENRESGEIITEKISLGKRKKWLQILSEKTGL